MFVVSTVASEYIHVTILLSLVVKAYVTLCVAMVRVRLARLVILEQMERLDTG